MKVAFSRIKITPKNYIGVPMAGYARPDPCLGKLDDIYAYGVLIEASNLDENKNFLVLVSLDLLKLPISIADYIRSKIIKKFNLLRPEQILLHCTHTHAAPDLTGEFHFPGGFFSTLKGIMFGLNRNDQYIIWFSHQVIKLVENLFNQLEPCKMAWKKESFNPDIVLNRRHPKRRAKPDLSVISFRRLDNNDLIGFIINYACHPTTLSFANNKMSADYPGRIISKIDELTNKKVKTIFFNGPAGDLNPITTSGTDYESLEKDKKPIYDQLGTFEHTIKIGTIIAQEALKLAQTIKDEDYFEELKISSRLKNFWVPFKDYKYFESTWWQNSLSHSVKKYFLLPITKITSDNANFPAFTMKRRPIGIQCHSIIQYVEICARSTTREKKMVVITVPGELFESLGKILLNKSPTRRENTFIFQNANDWIGYLFPPKEYIMNGGYEPVVSFSPRCGEYTMREMLNLFNEVGNK